MRVVWILRVIKKEVVSGERNNFICFGLKNIFNNSTCLLRIHEFFL